MPTRPNDAVTFHALHDNFLIVPNAWDAASARVIQEAGAKAVATSSAAVAWSQGFADGHHFPHTRLVAVIEDIARVVSVPVTCDAEGGYSDDPKQAAENIRALMGAGVVGINLEDGALPHELHLAKIEAIRAAAEQAGINLFINARTDVFLKQLAPPERAIEETLRRAIAIKNAGASGIFVPGVHRSEDIAAIAKGAGLPLNIMARPGVPNATALRALGAKRLSAAAGVFHAAMAVIRENTVAFLAEGDSEALWRRRGEPLDYNKLFGG